MEKLSKPDQLIIILSMQGYAGESLAEAFANALSCANIKCTKLSVGAIYVRLSRARKKLKDWLDNDEGKHG